HNRFIGNRYSAGDNMDFICRHSHGSQPSRAEMAHGDHAIRLIITAIGATPFALPEKPGDVISVRMRKELDAQVPDEVHPFDAVMQVFHQADLDLVFEEKRFDGIGPGRSVPTQLTGRSRKHTRSEPASGKRFEHEQRTINAPTRALPTVLIPCDHGSTAGE